MKVKKYKGSTIQEVVNMVRRDLGPEALILSTRKIREGEMASSSRCEELFEISAAAEESSGDLKTPASNRSSFTSLKSELMTIKEMILLLSRSGHLMEAFRTNPAAIDIYVKLLRSGIAESNVQLFLEKAGVFKENGLEPTTRLYERVLKEILNTVDVEDPFNNGAGQKVAAFIGPTGVGKTTTIAKLAADLSLKQKRSVGLISIDNYRVGAAEQLKIYARLLGIPCFSAFSSADLQFALRRMGEKEIILIDTAGQSHYDMERMEEMHRLIGSTRAISSHLLLSAVTGEPEMGQVAKNFGILNFISYIFTKTDETKARGVIINQILRSRRPISFVTTGQRVPEDIFKATKTRILQLIFE
ncbi:MAG: protein FlhF [Deltaproteobacteria bacterium]|nr:MAG: protein FlhF [Deltaproteobacteria bacterium]